MKKFIGFRAVAHLLEQLGDERFAVLIDSTNTGKVKELCDALVESALPTEMTIEGRTYDILSFLREGETSVVRHEVVTRAKGMSAHLGQDDGEHILRHQGQIPAILRDRAVFFFTGWSHPSDSRSIYYLCWNGECWVLDWLWLGTQLAHNDRFLRRK